jgi:hypothetical protein
MRKAVERGCLPFVTSRHGRVRVGMRVLTALKSGRSASESLDNRNRFFISPLDGSTKMEAFSPIAVVVVAIVAC